MTNFICTTCGVQFAASDHAPHSCPICEDERQYVNSAGQQWTTLEDLQATHHNRIELQEPNLYGIGTVPSFAIGQRALLIQSEHGNVLWDSISFLDAATIEAVNALGGISAIAISHPHFYSAAVEWAHAFNAPIYLHADDKQWVMRPDPAIQFWEGDVLTLQAGITVVRGGGHFAGSSFLHWAAGSGGKGSLFTGDTIYVVADRRWVSFMGSFPNLIPLAAHKVQAIVAATQPYEFERLYSGWWDAVVESDAKGAVVRSAERYIHALQ